MQVDLNRILTMVNDIASLVSFQTSKQHAYDIVGLLLQEIGSAVNADYTYLTFTMKNPNIKEQRFSRSFGIPEEQCMVFNKIIAEIISKGDREVANQYLFDLNESDGTAKIYDLRDVKTAIRIPILSSDLLDGFVYAYFSKEQRFEPEIFEFLSSLAGLIANTLISKETFVTEFDLIHTQQDYFQKLYNSVLVLDENLFIKNVNDAGAELLGGFKPSPDFQFNLSRHISEENLSLILSILDDLKTNELSKEISVKWMIDPENEDGILINVVFGFTKLERFGNFTEYLASGRITQIKENLTIKSRSNVDFDLMGRLLEYKAMYLENAYDTLKIFKTEFFPAAYVMLVNEMTGPLPLQSSPESDLMGVMQETIRIFAA
ncbi:MAG: hypothetical protein HeimC2_07010, partial [Candidatus Heimdallarchaeota archaeon LC_2]